MGSPTETPKKLRALLQTAGIEGTAVEIPNRYWPDSEYYDDVRTPWLRVYTRLGVIIIGWRKRVINIDWSDSVFAARGADVVAESRTTHDNTMCHAWGYDEAAQCLRRLWDGGGCPMASEDDKTDMTPEQEIAAWREWFAAGPGKFWEGVDDIEGELDSARGATPPVEPATLKVPAPAAWEHALSTLDMHGLITDVERAAEILGVPVPMAAEPPPTPVLPEGARVIDWKHGMRDGARHVTIRISVPSGMAPIYIADAAKAALAKGASDAE